MGRFIVLDIVFYGGSLNYDQGSGNYQELKKITKWDGKQYTLVSRYALRYSLLETGKSIGLWKLVDGSNLQRAGESDKTVIQPGISLLLSGKILEYPEFDLFGYLITNTKPQNSREAPVKISHAISMTPFSYDNHLSGNLGYARRMVSETGKMDPNLFNIEEHETYYIYTVVIDVDRIGKNEIYLAKEVGKDGKDWKIQIDGSENNYTIKIVKAKEKVIEGSYEAKTFKIKIDDGLTEEKEASGGQVNNSPSEIDVSIKEKNGKDVHSIEYSIQHDNFRKNRVNDLVKSILYLTRNIKAQSKDLSPKLLIVGVYKNNPYKSFKDRIRIVDEYEEEVTETHEPVVNGKKITLRVLKTRKPKFEVVSLLSDPKELSVKGVVDQINKIFVDDKTEVSETQIFYSPEIELKR